MGSVGADDLQLLVDAAAHGDDLALRELVLATQVTVLGMCRRLGSADDAEDLAQETYLRAVGALPSYRGEAPVLVWLLSIARHVCADHVRRRVRRGRVERRRPVGSAHGPPEHHIELLDLLRRLDRAQAEAFVLTQELGLSYAEAAQVCGCPVGTIRSRVSRARSTLREMVLRADAS